MCSCRKYLCIGGRLLEFLRRWVNLKIEICKEKYEVNLEFLEGGGGY